MISNKSNNSNTSNTSNKSMNYNTKMEIDM